MPYNFEATFVQPLLTQLDAGTIKGAESWADAITKAYITTIKMGLPQGAPATLPAPGLAVPPSPPPPYPIVTTPFTTADSRSKAMYNIVHAYFMAKEMKLEKGAIESLVATVKQLILKIKQRYRQVKALTERVKQITEQLKELPKLIKDIIEDIKEEVKTQIEKVKEIYDQLKSMEIDLGPIEFNNIFQQELAFIEKLKSFKITDVASVRDIALFISEYGKRTNNTLNTLSSSQGIKNYFQTKLISIGKEFLQFAEAAVDPTKILDFLNGIASARPRVERLLQKVKRFDLFVRFIQPKLRRLEKKKDDLIKKIRLAIQPKLLEVQKKLSDKVAEYTKRFQNSKMVSLYKNASKTIKDFKEKHQKKVKREKDRITLLKKAYQQTTKAIGASTALIEGLKLEFKSIQSEIEEYQKKLKNIELPSLQKPAAPDINLKDLSAKNLKAELAKASEYFNSLGLAEFGNLGALVITQAKCDFQTFKRFFEKKRDTIKKYVDEIIVLEKTVKGLFNTLQEIRDTRKKHKKVDAEKSNFEAWANARLKSMKDVLQTIVTWMKPTLNKLKKWISNKIKEVTEFVKKDLKKFEEDLKVFAINLLPIKSDLQDKKDAKQEAEAKLRKIRDKIAKIKRLIKLGSFVQKMVRGSLKLFNNVAIGNYKLSENQNAIDMFLDGLYGYKVEQSPSQQPMLMTQKRKFNEDFKALLIIEALAYGLIETIKDIKNTDFKQELQQLLQNAGKNAPGVATIKALMDLVENPPKDINSLKNALQSLGTDILLDASMASRLLSLERKYLNKSRETIKLLCDNKRVQKTKFAPKLEKIKNTLEKNQSFILLGFKMLNDELKAFMSWIRKKIKKVIDAIKAKLQAVRTKVEKHAQDEMKKYVEKKVNLEAPIMSVVMGLAARALWTGASWTSPAGIQHITLNIGAFTPMKAKSTDGASKMIREMAKGFEAQLSVMSGLVIPPAPTGIPPIPFTGYK